MFYDVFIKVDFVIDTFDYVLNSIGFFGTEHFDTVQWLVQLPILTNAVIIDSPYK